MRTQLQALAVAVSNDYDPERWVVRHLLKTPSTVTRGEIKTAVESGELTYDEGENLYDALHRDWSDKWYD